METAEKRKQTKIITKKVFDYVCNRYHCTHEDIRDCSVKNILARTAFVKALHLMEVSVESIGQMLGDRTSECIESYLIGNGGNLKY